uniref:Uncharacterized protein n=1 Tax=Rhipicephalus microplus TaxID=6941 RepID=A0A6G5AHS9_RHIMP
MPCTYCVYYEFMSPILSPKCPRACRHLASVTWCCALRRKQKPCHCFFCIGQKAAGPLKVTACWPRRHSNCKQHTQYKMLGNRHKCFISNTSFLDPFCTNTHSTLRNHPHSRPLSVPTTFQALQSLFVNCCPSHFAKAQHSRSTETATRTLLTVTIVAY